MLIKRGVLAAVLMLLAVSVAACGSSGGGSSGDSIGENDPVVIAQLKGPAAQGDEAFKQGMEIAAKEINENGGAAGHEIKLKFIPTEATPEAVSAAYRAAGDDPQVLGVFNGSGGGLAIRNLSESVKVPAITASGNDKVDRPATKYVFANAETGPYATAPLVYENEQKPVKSIAVLHYETDYSQQIPGAIEARCQELGCDVTTVEASESTASRAQLVPLLTKMRATNPDVYAIEELNVNALKAARDLGMFDRPVIGSNWLANNAVGQAAGKTGEDVVFASSKCRLSDLKELEPGDPMIEFCSNYEQRFNTLFPGEELQGFSIYGYDAVKAFAVAVEKLVEEDEPINRDTVAEALADFGGKDLLTSTGYVQTSEDDHRLVGSFEEGFVNMQMHVTPKGIVYKLAPNANPGGAKP